MSRQVAIGFYAVDLPRASDLFFEVSRNRVKAPGTARERYAQGCAFSATRWRMISKNAAGTRRAKRLRKRLLPTFGLQKSVVVPGTGIEKRHGCQARATRKKNKPKEQAKRSRNKIKKQDQAKNKRWVPPYPLFCSSQIIAEFLDKHASKFTVGLYRGLRF